MLLGRVQGLEQRRREVAFQQQQSTLRSRWQQGLGSRFHRRARRHASDRPPSSSDTTRERQLSANSATPVRNKFKHTPQQAGRILTGLTASFGSLVLLRSRSNAC